MEPISAAFMTFGTVLLAISWFYLMIIAFREDFSWGICTVLLPPLSYLYSCFAWNKAKDALIMAIGGLALIILGLV